MALLSNRLMSFLDREAVPYHIVHHRTDFTAQQAAADTHTPGREFAKTVVLEVGDGHVLAVLPAPRKVDLAKATDQLGARATLADEPRIAALFPDCEVGAEPPFGNLYGLPVYVSPELTEDEFITFNAGTHQEAIRMRYRDFERLVQPRVMDLSGWA